MAISNNPLLKGVSGSLGDQITIKNYNGKIVICQKIEARKKPASKKQKNNESRFGKANKAAKTLYADQAERNKVSKRLGLPKGRALYQAILKELLTGV